ncbi:hypothetical protein QYF36_007448 [Acer negundo]|nr:hypothetical protein QYF36_007448 [Acer negundo]
MTPLPVGVVPRLILGSQGTTRPLGSDFLTLLFPRFANLMKEMGLAKRWFLVKGIGFRCVFGKVRTCTMVCLCCVRAFMIDGRNRRMGITVLKPEALVVIWRAMIGDREHQMKPPNFAFLGRIVILLQLVFPTIITPLSLLLP